MKNVLMILGFVVSFFNSFAQSGSVDVLHHVDKLDADLDYFYIKPLVIKNSNGKSLTINIESISSGYILSLKVSGAKSNCINKGENLIFSFSDSVKRVPMNKFESNCKGEAGVLLKDEELSELEASYALKTGSLVSLTYPYDTYIAFREKYLEIVRIYTSGGYLEFNLNHEQASLLRKRFTALIDIKAKGKVSMH